MFREMGIESSARAVADQYRGVIDGFVLDTVDEAQAREIEAGGVSVLVTNTIMQNEKDRERLAKEIVDWVIRQTDG